MACPMFKLTPKKCFSTAEESLEQRKYITASNVNFFHNPTTPKMPPFYLLLLALCLALTTAQDTTTPVVNVVLVGALGDLSKKYLIQAFARLDAIKKTQAMGAAQPELVLWPGSRSATDKGRLAMADILKQHLACKKGTDFNLPGEKQDCVAHQSKFKTRIMPYLQLKHDQQYKDLNAAIDAHNTKHHYQESGRLLYLSIPPKAYHSVSKSIGQHLRPATTFPRTADAATTTTNNDRPAPWLRVVFEKPFGSDEASAIELATSIGESLQEEEIYRIDHYLGKAGVQVIYQFRVANAETYEALLTHEHVAHVDVVMTEQTDCAGRAGYYDDYGVVRDLHQNHLSEMMALGMMDLVNTKPTVQHQQHNEAMNQHKMHLFNAIPAPSFTDAILGQYQTYQEHVEQDRAKWMKDDAQITQKTVTPTFAAVRLHLDNDRWRNVPVYVTSGKAMDTREAYVRFVFKNGEELLFNVQGGGKGTHVQATRGLPVFDIPKGWTNGNVDGTTPTRFITPLSNPGAYDNLVAKVWQGDTSHFVATDTLLASWRLWTPLLHELEVQEETPLTYTQGGFEMQAALAEFKRDWFRASEGQGQGVGHGEL